MTTMLKDMRRAVLLPAVLCAITLGCSQQADLLADGWIGRTAADLEHVWGQPSEQADGPTGRTVTYVSYWNRTMSQIKSCRQIFTIDAKDRITGHTASECSK